MKTALFFLLVAVLNKIIRDTLPNLSLIKGFQKYIEPLLLLGYLHLLQAAIRRAKKPEVKHRLQLTLVVLSISILIDKQPMKIRS